VAHQPESTRTILGLATEQPQGVHMVWAVVFIDVAKPSRRSLSFFEPHSTLRCKSKAQFQ